MNNAFIGFLVYANDVTIICPNLKGPNKMIEICTEDAAANHTYFNSKKTICIKYGDSVIEALLNRICLTWKDNVRHYTITCAVTMMI